MGKSWHGRRAFAKSRTGLLKTQENLALEAQQTPTSPPSTSSPRCGKHQRSEDVCGIRKPEQTGSSLRAFGIPGQAAKSTSPSPSRESDSTLLSSDNRTPARVWLCFRDVEPCRLPSAQGRQAAFESPASARIEASASASNL